MCIMGNEWPHLIKDNIKNGNKIELMLVLPRMDRFNAAENTIDVWEFLTAHSHYVLVL